MKMNFEYFQIQKWILKTGRLEKVGQENGVICLVSMLLSWVIFFKLSKKVHFLQFCADLSKKSKFIKAIFTYMHLKGLVTHFQKMVLFVVLWLTIFEILVFEVEEFCWISVESTTFLMFQLLITHERWLRPP